MATRQKLQLPCLHVMLFLFNLVTIGPINAASPYASEISYHDYCNSIVPEPTVSGTETEIFPGNFLQLRNGYYLGGDRSLGQESESSSSSPETSRYMHFYVRNVYQTDTPGVLMVEGKLGFQGSKACSDSVNSTYVRSHNGRLPHRRPRFQVLQPGVDFNLQGFWSASTGNLCMVGSGSGMSYSEEEGKSPKLSAVFKLNYPQNSTILTSLVGGTLESLDKVDSSNYFEPISVLAYSQGKYDYSLINNEIDNGWSSPNGVQQELAYLGLPSRVDICSVLSRNTPFKLEYRRDCDDSEAANCRLLDNSSNGFLTGTMFLDGLRCSNNQKMRLAMVFTNDSSFNHPFNPKTSLVGEGVWDAKNNQLYVVACRILNFTDSLAGASVGNCSIRMNLRFPAVLSIRNRNSVVGQIWSNATANTSGFFDAISFHGEYLSPVVSSVKYEYSVMGGIRKLCDVKTAKSKGAIYPDGYSDDMVFHMSVKSDLGQLARGFATPQTIGDQFHEYFARSFVLQSEPVGDAPQVSTNNHSSLLNVSYQMIFTILSDFKFGRIPLNASTTVQISAEGIYSDETGSVCMVGCRFLDSKQNIPAKNDSLDCKIVINLQFSPLDAEVGGTHVTGTIKSTREKSDPLYFKSLEVLSDVVYHGQAQESIWRMDLEITMVLISNTLACVFIGMQLFYVKKHPDMVPFISVVMLVILTLGQMIPLLLNFEALFMGGRNRQNVLLGNGGWLEVNEVIVRVITMVAFLLQFRLLQQVWPARWSNGCHKGLWTAEIKALYVILPLYLLGGLITLFVHWKNSYTEGPVISEFSMNSYEQHYLWGDMKSYAGLVLDGFLLPQILFNLFLNSKEKALAPTFYVGMSVVRLLPHAYDLYRTHYYGRYLNVSYIYASHGVDFYSTAWNILIPFGGMLFAIITFLQQRFGGNCILPMKFRESVPYEKVPVISG